jgi:SAM-dependent methyltransferase
VSSDPPPIPSVDRCLELLRRGFGRSAAAEMWRYLWNAGPDEPVENLLRILRNYATHWTREDRYDVSHSFGAWRTVDGRGESRGLGDELDALKQVSAGVEGRQRFVHWLDEMKRLRPRKGTAPEPRRDASRASERIQAEREDERLRSWIRAAALMRQLESKTAAPLEKDIYALERTLQARSSPEIAFWHILLARAWASSAAHGMVARAIDDDAPWNKAMRALIVAAGVASSRRLPYEMAASLLSAAALTRIGLSTPELRAEFSTQGVDEEGVRVQAAECALLAADAYQWLDAEQHHWGALLDAAALLQGSAFPERLIQAFQLLALARNNRLLYREHHEIPRDALDAPAQFERYPLAADAGAGRARREDKLFDEIYRSWLTSPGRLQTSDDPGTIVTHGYFSRYIPGVQQLFGSSSLSSSLQIEFEAEPGEPGEPARAVDRLLGLVDERYHRPVMTRILDFGCGAGDDARHLAKHHEVWAVDSPLWFATERTAPPAADAGPAPRFLKIDPVEYARRVRDGKPPEGSPGELDAVLFRCSLFRISHRATLLEAAHRLLKPGGLVIATDWVQTRVTDRITWSRLVGTGRLVDLDTEPGYRRLCDKLGFVDFASWDWTAERSARAPAMYRWFERRLKEVRRLEDERGGPRWSPYERAFLLRLKRDLEAFVALSGPEGPLGWVFWSARKPAGAS